MRNRVGVGLRLVVMLVMALGLATLMASPAAAQTSQTGQCQILNGPNGPIDQQPCTVVVDSQGQCQVIVDNQTFQNAQGCGEQSCPRQIVSGTTIFQFQCGVEVTNTPVPPTNVPPTSVPPTNVPPTSVPPTNVPPTSVPPTSVPLTNVPPTSVPPTNVPPTDVPATHAPATDVPATHVPATDVPDDDDGGQAEEPMQVSVLPETGQGPDDGQSNTANMLLLGAMGMILTVGAVALRLRKNS